MEYRRVNGLLAMMNKDRAAVDRMIDLGLCSLHDFNDNVDRLMDYLLSSKGGELDEQEWDEVEQELKDYLVDDIEMGNNDYETAIDALAAMKTGKLNTAKFLIDREIERRKAKGRKE